MSFWNTSSGESAINENNTSFEIEGGGDILPIPAGTKVLAMIETVKWATVRDSTERYVEIKWSVLKAEAYKNRKIFQKLWVADHDPAQNDLEKAKRKKDKALKMLAAIDANAGGRLSKASGEPDNDTLALALNNKLMVIGLNTWDDAETKKPKGNWVYYVGPKADAITEVTKEDIAKQREQASSFTPNPRDLDDGIPF